ncbi:uncharacterized protein EV420DRAFT_1487734 [Desarmillaria tabescens]|uniref:Uncharacterized protein n=1 Tax=Armillaria tabescens TaxID=1929756 RepID=A0AA39J632_ARMTA|nr:uncharacterized protein EV420DRAFT_1487734 [Desarmillaria tabescens]KAK0435941.1 hypothetical protein EV420DRAFT_1487734 [Desarmillaria tabescens]
MPHHTNPFPFIYSTDPVPLSFEESTLLANDLSHIDLNPSEMKRPVSFNIDHPWRPFRFSQDSPKLTRAGEKGVMFRRNWVKEVVKDFRDAKECVELVTKHPWYVPKSTLPRLFNIELLCSVYPSPEQAQKIRKSVDPPFIHPNSLVYLRIPNWAPIPLNKRSWLLMRWTNEFEVVAHDNGEGRSIIHFLYEKIIEWTPGSPSSRKAWLRLESARVNSSLDEIQSLAERHISTHSPGFDILEITPWLQFPYTKIAPYPSDDEAEIDLVSPNLYPKAPEKALNIVKMEPTEELTYPFEEVMVNSELPVPGPIAGASSLPHEVGCLTDVPSDASEDVTQKIEEIFGSPSQSVDLSSMKSSSHASMASHLEARISWASPYQIRDPRRIMARMASSPEFEQSTSSPPTSHSSDATVEHYSAAESLISQDIQSLETSFTMSLTG